MSAIHVATSSAKAKEMVEVVLAEIDGVRWHAANQAANIWDDKHEVANAAIYEVVEHLREQLQVAVAITLASWGVS